MPNSFSSSSLLNPATDQFSDHMPVNALGQSQSSGLTSGYAAANTPLTPITPLTPVSTTAFYSNNISAPTSDVSNLRVSSSLPTLSHEVDMHENFMNFHPDMKARMHSVSLPTPPIAVNGAGQPTAAAQPR
ncbi:hypothetical protein KEM56_007111 [Ascosphaera pollenicola]|nr:hypothetical protein KEM56_007111 [Ascosphaera pollenicola]